MTDETRTLADLFNKRKNSFSKGCGGNVLFNLSKGRRNTESFRNYKSIYYIGAE
jgi:hypothetical protein